MRYQQRQTTVSRSFWSFSCFFKIKFYWKSALGLFIYGLSMAAFALQQQGSTSALCWPPRDHLAAKPKTFTVWRFTKKFCQPGWLRHMFLKKKKKERKKQRNKDYWALSLSRHRETELKFHAPSQTLVPGACHLSRCTIVMLLQRTSIWPNCSNATDRICKKKREVARLC